MISAAGILGLFAYRLQWLKKIRVSFPEESGRFLDSFLKNGFGNEKIERYASRCWSASRETTIRCTGYLKSHQITAKIKERADRFLGKRVMIPDRETSSVFLRSIAEHKKKTHEVAEIGDIKDENMPV